MILGHIIQRYLIVYLLSLFLQNQDQTHKQLKMRIGFLNNILIILFLNQLTNCFNKIESKNDNSVSSQQSITAQSYVKNNKNDPKICDGNRFKHISTYALGRQNDVTLTFQTMETQTKVDKVVYKDQLFRTYTIFPLNMTFNYYELKQSANTIGFDQVKITGGTLKINYTFAWEKKQLSSSIQGIGKGVVTTDPITFIKSLNINNQTRQLEWNFVSAEPITITNSLTIQSLTPYKAADYDVINQMLNQLKSGEATVKSKLIAALNANFTKILAKIVHENNDTWREPNNIYYSYSDYHGQFDLIFDNVILNASLAKGLDILLSQAIQNDSKFQCGEKVPIDPEDEVKYGGLQQFISNMMLKSTLRNAINKGFLDVILTQQFWQSPAFQFYMGDVHEVIPSTKNISSLQPITGKCRALDDKYYNLTNKTNKTYLASVNFTCDLKFANNTKKLLGLNLAINYEVGVTLLANTLLFKIVNIGGTPTFFQEDEYKIKNMDLAEFMIQQTLNMAIGEKVLGSGFKTLNRKFPNLQVREKYLFLYDTATRLSKYRQNNKSQRTNTVLQEIE